MKTSTRDRAQGTAKKIAGRVNEVTGKVIGNSRLQAAGKAEKVKGQVQTKVGKAEKKLGR